MGVVAKSYMRKGFLIYEKSMNFQALRYEYLTTFLKKLLGLATAQCPLFLYYFTQWMSLQALR
jgi:hypothetical protein